MSIKYRRLIISGLVAFLAGPHLHAQIVRSIPIRKLSRAVATDSGIVEQISHLHALSNGTVFVNDRALHRVILFDSSMRVVKLVADNAEGAALRFGSGVGAIIAFPGDSTVFVDQDSRTLVVLNSAGDVARVMAPPKPTDFTYLGFPLYGMTSFDEKGRIYYRASFPSGPSNGIRGPNDSIKTSFDVVPIVRGDFELRRVDTIAAFQAGQVKLVLAMNQSGRVVNTVFSNPLPVLDMWGVLSDGTVGIVRGHDYHIDWILPNGELRATPKMPFAWSRLSEEEKQQRMDSAQNVIDSTKAAKDAATAAQKGQTLANSAYMELLTETRLVNIRELPDYIPPLRQYVPIRVDDKDNLWILPTTSVSSDGGLLYDVVNRNGEIFERVQLPAGRVLEGVGKNGTVYMSVPKCVGYPRLERARIIR